MTDPVIERPAIAGAQFLPLNLCRAVSFNPRKRFQAEALNELADSIEKFGVMQPVLARPIAGAKRGGPQYEIVAGERRFRASKMVADRRKESEIATIPAIVRELSDFDALELATTENLQRQDLHPLEEAEGFEGLLLHPIAGGEFSPPRLHGYTVDELAARIGKSRGYVFGRLKLLALIPGAREAFYADKISASIALLLARMPAAVQTPALKEVLQGWAGEPLGYRQTRDMLERQYMLKLSSAPFKITDESLVPSAGSCKACPKRTGANPDLFEDVKGADVCTDLKCFEGKREAHQARLVEAAKAEGREVIMGAAAKKVMPHRHGDLKGYTPIEEPQFGGLGGKPLEKLLGKDAPPVALLENPHTHELVRVVRTDEAMKVLKDKGLLKSAKSKSETDYNAKQRAAEAKAKAEVRWRTEVATRAVAAVVDPQYDDADVHAWLLPHLARAMWHRMDHDTTKRAESILGWEPIKGQMYDGSYDKAVEAKFSELSVAQLDQVLVAMTIAGELHVNQYNLSGSKPKRLLEVAGKLGIDGARVRAELDAADKAKAAKKSAKTKTPAAADKASPKKAAKKSVAPKKVQPKPKRPAGATRRPAKAKETTQAGTVTGDSAVGDEAKRNGEPAGPGGSDSNPVATVFKVGDAARVRKTSTGRKTAKDGRAGKVDEILADGRLVLKWGSRTHERCVYQPDELEHVDGAIAAAANITPAAAWPFPTGPRPSTDVDESSTEEAAA